MSKRSAPWARRRACSESPTYGGQERSLPRPGNVHTAENWRALPGPVAALYRKREVRRYFQADAAFAKPAIYRFLEADGHHSRPKLPGMTLVLIWIKDSGRNLSQLSSWRSANREMSLSSSVERAN